MDYERFCLTSYPVREIGGIVFVWYGDKEPDKEPACFDVMTDPSTEAFFPTIILVHDIRDIPSLVVSSICALPSKPKFNNKETIPIFNLNSTIIILLLMLQIYCFFIELVPFFKNNSYFCSY